MSNTDDLCEGLRHHNIMLVVHMVEANMEAKNVKYLDKDASSLDSSHWVL